MISSHVKHQTLSVPRTDTSSNLAGKRFASLGNLFKSDSSTSLHDIVITSSRPQKGTNQKRARDSRTVVPLLGRDGSAAALVPERSKSLNERGSTRKSRDGKTQGLRFPLLSPTRQETMLFFKMKALKDAARLTDKRYLENNDFNARQQSPAVKSVMSSSNPPSRLPTRGCASVELTKVPPLRERQQLLSTLHPNAPAISTGRTPAGTRKHDKIIIPSKYGYHSRSNSATYKRLNRARTQMDNIIKSQVVEFTSKPELPDIFTHGADNDVNQSTATRAISLQKDRSYLYFNIDPGVYDYFKEKKDLKKLYRSSIKSGKSNRSSNSTSSGKSLTIVLPRVDTDVGPASTIATDRSQTHERQSALRNSNEKTSVSLQNPTSTNSNERLPAMRRSVTFDHSVPSSPKKRSRKTKRHPPASTSTSTAAANAAGGERDDVTFLVDGSKSLTPSPKKGKRSQQRLTSVTSIHSNHSAEQNTNTAAHNAALQHTDTSSHDVHGRRNASPSKQQKQKSRSSSRFSEKLHDYETSYMQLSAAKEKQDSTVLAAAEVGAAARDVISPPILDSDDEYNDEFENI